VHFPTSIIRPAVARLLLLFLTSMVADSRAQEKSVDRHVRREALRLISDDLKKGPPLVFGNTAAEEIPVDVVALDPLVITDKKIPDFTPPREAKFEKFVRTGTIWQKGRVRVWAKGDRGIMIDLPF
jgi:hypothetical protein